MENVKSKINTSVLDKALELVVKANKNRVYVGNDIPNVIHYLEVVAITATMTDDQELLAAAALCDIVYDCGISLRDIDIQFGARVANVVRDITSANLVATNPNINWKDSKKAIIDKVKNASRDTKIVGLANKLSHMRAIGQDFGNNRDKIWVKFKPLTHNDVEWFYRALADAFIELYEQNAYKEFTFLINKVFLNAGDDFSFKNENNTIYLKGKFYREQSLELEKALKPGVDYVLDFSGVGDINFAGMRTLIRMHYAGYRLALCNVQSGVALKLYKVSLNTHLPISEKPELISLASYEKSGEGFTANSYFSNDEDSMMKLYYQGVSLRDIEVEKMKAHETFLLGVPTPLPGDIITHDGSYGITFERILNKSSFGKMLGLEPKRSDELAKIMANETIKLHSLQCNTNIFPNEKLLFKKAIDKFTPFTKEEFKKTYEFVDNIPDVTTCLHGDFHPGNIIMTKDGDVLFIDMGDFAYGDPRFDLGCLYFNMHNPLPGAAQKVFHCEPEQLTVFWRDFIKHYYSLKTEKEIDEKTEEIKPYAGLVVIYYAARIRVETWMNDLVHDLMKNVL